MAVAVAVTVAVTVAVKPAGSPGRTRWTHARETHSGPVKVVLTCACARETRLETGNGPPPTLRREGHSRVGIRGETR